MKILKNKTLLYISVILLTAIMSFGVSCSKKKDAGKTFTLHVSVINGSPADDKGKKPPATVSITIDDKVMGQKEYVLKDDKPLVLKKNLKPGAHTLKIMEEGTKAVGTSNLLVDNDYSLTAKFVRESDSIGTFQIDNKLGIPGYTYEEKEKQNKDVNNSDKNDEKLDKKFEEMKKEAEKKKAGKKSKPDKKK